ncbi:MAG: DUF6508 domain-containing protein [Acidimicrobiales bacterium]
MLTGVRAAGHEQWERLWTALDRLLAESKPVEWVSPEKRPDGVIVMGWPQYSEALTETVDALDGVGAISSSFDWPAWHRSWLSSGRGAAELRVGPASDAVRYITSIVRGDHFADGALGEAMREGTLPAAMTRLREWYDNGRLGDDRGADDMPPEFTELTPCVDCVHRYFEEYLPPTCDAYPDPPGIPEEILLGDDLHTAPRGNEALDDLGQPIIFLKHEPS